MVSVYTVCSNGGSGWKGHEYLEEFDRSKLKGRKGLAASDSFNVCPRGGSGWKGRHYLKNLYRLKLEQRKGLATMSVWMVS